VGARIAEDELATEEAQRRSSSRGAPRDSNGGTWRLTMDCIVLSGPDGVEAMNDRAARSKTICKKPL